MNHLSFGGLTPPSSAAAGAKVKPEVSGNAARPGGRLQRVVRPVTLECFFLGRIAEDQAQSLFGFFRRIDLR